MSYLINYLKKKSNISKGLKMKAILTYILFLYNTNELYDCSEQLSQWSEWFGSDTEVEAIIKACEWLLNEVDK